MSNNDRQGRQSVGSDASVQGDSASLLDAIFSLSQGGSRPALGEGGGATGNGPQLLVPFPQQQQQQGLSLDPTVERQSLADLQRSGFQNLLTLSNLRNLQAQSPHFNGFNQPAPNLSFNPPAKTATVSLSLAAHFSTALPSLASPQQTAPSSKLNNLRLAIATRDPSESVDDVLSPRSLSFLHSHFQSMGLELPASASWGQIQQMLEAPPCTNLHASSSFLSGGQDGGIGGVAQQQDSGASLLSSFSSGQDNNHWNMTQDAGGSILDRFMASVNLPANETNERIKKLAANLILQQQQQQQEQQRLLRQQQLSQLQESFQLHAQIPPIPSFHQQPNQTPPALANLQGLLGNANLGAPQDALRSGHLSSAQLPKLTPQMNELLQAALSKDNQGGMNSFLDTQRFATLQQLARGGQQPPVPDQVAQVIVGQRPPARRPGGASAAFEPGGFQGQQNLASLVSPLTSEAMRKALMAGGALSGQPAESAGGSHSQGSVRTGKRGLSYRGDSQQTSLEEASAESSPTEQKRPRQGFSPQPSSKLSYGAIPRAPTFNNRISQVTIPPLPPTPNLQFQSPLSLPPVPGIARPTKTPGGAYSFQSPVGGSLHLLSPSGEQKGQAQLLAEAVRRGEGIGRGAEVDKARGESTPVKMNRARRGEATDPHSVAERHRRERLAEKMTELFSLVPHRHKKDKATMLEEIIEYVKMMQLQVQVLSVGPQLSAQSAQEDFPGGLPAAATRRGGGPPGSGLAVAAAAAPRFTSQLQRSPEHAVRFLLDRGLCLVPAHLAAKLLELPPEELARRPTSAKPSARDPVPAVTLQGSPLMTSPSETEGARAPAAVFSGWEEEEDQAAAKAREDALEVANAFREQEQREARSESGLASSGGMNVDSIGRPYRRSHSEEEQDVDQLPTMQSGDDFNAMSPGLGEGLDLPGFGKGDPMVEGGRMSWDSDPHV